MQLSLIRCFHESTATKIAKCNTMHESLYQAKKTSKVFLVPYDPPTPSLPALSVHLLSTCHIIFLVYLSLPPLNTRMPPQPLCYFISSVDIHVLPTSLPSSFPWHFLSFCLVQMMCGCTLPEAMLIVTCAFYWLLWLWHWLPLSLFTSSIVCHPDGRPGALFWSQKMKGKEVKRRIFGWIERRMTLLTR